MAAPVCAAWNSLYAAAYLLDAVEDGDGIPGWTYPPDQTTNLATGLIFRSHSILSSLEDKGYSAGLARDLRQAFNQSILKVCAGQDACFTASSTSLADAWDRVDAKSGHFFALACYAGARLATRSQKKLDEFCRFGRTIGRLIQIGDDLGDLWGDARQPSDLGAKRFGALPQAYAEETLPPAAKAALREWIAAISSDPNAEAKARQVILEAGAAVYLSLETRHLRIQGQQALFNACPPSPSQVSLIKILNETGWDAEKRERVFSRQNEAVI